MTSDFEWAVELNRFGLELIGLLPKTGADKNSLVSDLRVATVFITTLLSVIIPILWALVRIWGDASLMIDNLQITLPLMIILLKLTIMRWKQTGISV